MAMHSCVQIQPQHVFPFYRNFILRAALVSMFVMVGVEAMALPPVWTDKNKDFAFALQNQHGRNPRIASMPPSVRKHFKDRPHEAASSGSGNFIFQVPILNISGRGLPLALVMTYNSQVWMDDGTGSLTFDPDSGWPAPGWTLGFGKLQRFDQSDLVMVVDADGTRHPFDGSAPISNQARWFTGRTTDGLMMDYRVQLPSLDPLPGGLGNPNKTGILFGRVQYPDGRLVDYSPSAPTSNESYPTRIMDTNGNFISITYRNGKGPAIDTITDTVGRTFHFHYDANNHLISITGPGLNGITQTIVRLHYKTLAAQADLDAIVFPATGRGWWFGDPTSYSEFGMIRVVSERRGMQLSAPSLTDAGVVTSSGTMTHAKTYAYSGRPLSGIRRTTPTSLPTFSSMSEEWVNMDTSAAITKYSSSRVGDKWVSGVTYPDGSRYVLTETSDGLMRHADRYDTDGTTQLMSESYTWEPGEYNSKRVKRVTRTDSLGQITAEEFDYGRYNQITERREYDFGGTQVLRRTHTNYLVSSGHEGNHIFNLPRVVEVIDGASLVPTVRTEYAYDASPLLDTPGVLQHDGAYNPFAKVTIIPGTCTEACTSDPTHPDRGEQCREVCTSDKKQTDFKPTTQYRGNLTSITRYADTAHRAGAQIESYTYDIAGNRRDTTGSACCDHIVASYSPTTQYAYPETVMAGAADPASSVRRTVRTTYDLSTGLPLSITEPSGRWREFQYAATTHRLEHMLQYTPGRSGADYQADYSYDDATFTRTETVSDGHQAIAHRASVQLNGLGLVRRTQTIPSMGMTDIVDVQYDVMQRVWHQSRPYRTGFNPVWTTVSYDGLGRVTSTVGPEGSTTAITYNQRQRPGDASNEPGATAYQLDPWQRGVWHRTDALGRLVEVLEPAAGGSGSVFEPEATAARYVYDVLDHLIGFDRSAPSAMRQHGVFQYDGLGRLTGRRLPERARTLLVDGTYSFAYGLFSDVYKYDGRGNLTSHTDARGIRTIFDYGNDPLHRLQAIHYDRTGFGDLGNPVVDTDDVTYQYLSTGDVALLQSVTTATATTTFNYNNRSLPEYVETTLAAFPQNPISIGYSYDGFDRLSDLTYPPDYGTATIVGLNRKQIYHHFVRHVDYDQGSRPMDVLVDGTSFISGILYAPDAQVASLNIGHDQGLLGETYDIDALTGTLNMQTVTSSQGPLLSLSYNYKRDGAIGQTGQVTAETDNLTAANTRWYQYDALGQLSTVTYGQDPTASTSWMHQFGYDLFGNRTRSKAFGAPSLPLRCVAGQKCVGGTRPELGPESRDGLDGLSYDSETNRIITDGYRYDAAGNIVRAQAKNGQWQRYQYDAAGRLVVVTDDAGNQLERELYGADTYRLARIAGMGDLPHGQVTLYAWDGGHVVTEFQRNIQATSPELRWNKHYVYLGERLVATLVRTAGQLGTLGTHPPPTVNYFHLGRIGSRLVTDSQGKSVSTSHPYPFGTEATSASATSDTHQFSSYDRSTITGLDYAVGRYYSASLGRFLQRDPLGLGASMLAFPRTLNGYSYVTNDPVNHVDPLGLDEQSAPKECKEGSAWDLELGICVLQTTVHAPRYWDLPPPGYNSWSSNGETGGSGGGPSLIEKIKKWSPLTEKQKECRDARLRNYYSNFGGTAIETFSIGGLVVSPYETATSLFEAAGLKGGAIRYLIPWAELGIANQTIKNIDYLPKTGFDLDSQVALEAEYSARALSDIKFLGNVRVLGETLGEAGLAATLFSTIQDANVTAECLGY